MYLQRFNKTGAKLWEFASQNIYFEHRQAIIGTQTKQTERHTDGETDGKTTGARINQPFLRKFLVLFSIFFYI